MGKPQNFLPRLKKIELRISKEEFAPVGENCRGPKLKPAKRVGLTVMGGYHIFNWENSILIMLI